MRTLAGIVLLVLALAALAPAAGAQEAAEATPTAVLRAVVTLAPLNLGPMQVASSTPVAAAPTPTPAVVPTFDLEPTEPSAIEHEERPIIVVHDFSVEPGRPAPGTGFRLKLRLHNVGEHFAENIRVGLGGGSFLPAGHGTALFLNELDEGEKETLEIDLRVASGLTAGVYPLTIALGWDDSYGGSYAEQTSIGIEVGGAGGTRPSVVVTASRLPGRVAPGVPFTLALDLLNSGGREARNVVVVPTVGPLALQGTGGGAPVSIPAGAVATVSLRVMAGQVGDPGAMSQAFDLRYEDADGERYSDSQTIGLVVTGDAAYGPMPMVAGYVLERSGKALGEVHPGEVFDLVLEITNVGVADALRTRLTLGGGGAPSGGAGGVFAPLDTGSVRFLDRLAAGEERSIVQQMVVDGAAKPGVYVLDVAFDYVDADGQPLQSGEVVTLLVSRLVEIRINPLDVVTSTIEGVPIDLAAEIVNAGGATVNVTTAEIVAERRFFEVEDGLRFIGSLDKGGIDVIDARLVPSLPPGLEGDEHTAEAKIVVHYFDDFNREQSVERVFEFTIRAAELPEPGEELDEDRPVEEVSMWRRVLKGLFGLGASAPTPTPGDFMVAPAGAVIIEGGD